MQEVDCPVTLHFIATIWELTLTNAWGEVCKEIQPKDRDYLYFLINLAKNLESPGLKIPKIKRTEKLRKSIKRDQLEDVLQKENITKTIFKTYDVPCSKDCFAIYHLQLKKYKRIFIFIIFCYKV